MTNVEIVRIKDFHTIEKSIEKYLSKKMTLMEMISNIEMFANVTFNNNETYDFYVFLINTIGDIEVKYFMKGDEYTHHNEVVGLVIEFQEKLKQYKSNFEAYRSGNNDNSHPH